MKRILLIGLLTMATGPLWAASGQLTTSGSSCTSTAICLTVNLPQDKGGAVLAISGTWTGTISFEGTGDGGVTWVAINMTPLASTTLATSTTGNGQWQRNVAGFTGIRARASATMTGTAAVTITPSAAAAP